MTDSDTEEKTKRVRDEAHRKSNAHQKRGRVNLKNYSSRKFFVFRSRSEAS